MTTLILTSLAVAQLAVLLAPAVRWAARRLRRPPQPAPHRPQRSKGQTAFGGIRNEDL